MLLVAIAGLIMVMAVVFAIRQGHKIDQNRAVHRRRIHYSTNHQSTPGSR